MSVAAQRPVPAPTEAAARTPREFSAAAALAMLQQPIEPVPKTVLYHLSLLVVTAVMLVLPVIYLGSIVVIAWLVYLHLVNDVGMLGVARGRAAIIVLAAYLAPAIAGGIAILFMFKPFFAPKHEEHVPLSITEGDEPFLFKFVETLCDAVNAPTPRRIDVDTQANASASFRKGVWSMFGNDLVLTIGLPLAAGLNMRELTGVLAHEFGHFAQGGGMRLTYVIRRISGWFARVVYERDEWDYRLEQWAADGGHITITLVLQLARLCVWLSRRVLWALMYVGHIVSCILLRQMEYDADRYEARVAGSDAFAATARKLPLLSVATNMTFDDLRRSYAAGMLSENLPEMINQHSRRLPKDLLKKIEEHTASTRTGLFDTHPADRDRIASAQREDAPGTFTFEQPARLLFRDFDKLCKLATQHHYTVAIGSEHLRDIKMVPVSELMQTSQVDDDAANTAMRFYQYPLPVQVPIQLDQANLGKPADASAAKQAVINARTNYEGIVSTLKPVFGEYETLHGRRSSVLIARALGRCNYRVPQKDLGVRGKDDAGLTSELEGIEAEIRRTRPRARTLADAASRRLAANLRWLATDDGASVKNADKLRPAASVLVKALNAIAEHTHELIELQDNFTEAAVLLRSCENGGTEEAVARIRRLLAELADDMHRIRASLASTRYPFRHARGKVSIGEYVMDKAVPASDIGATMDAADQMLERMAGLYGRCIARLAWICERTESAVGLKPLPEPQLD